MVEIETTDDIANDLANKLEIYGEKRSFFVADLTVRMRDAVTNEKRLYGSSD